MSEEPAPGLRVGAPRGVALCAQEARLSGGGQALGEGRSWLAARLGLLGSPAEAPELLLPVRRDGEVAAVVVLAQGVESIAELTDTARSVRRLGLALGAGLTGRRTAEHFLLVCKNSTVNNFYRWVTNSKHPHNNPTKNKLKHKHQKQTQTNLP